MRLETREQDRSATSAPAGLSSPDGRLLPTLTAQGKPAGQSRLVKTSADPNRDTREFQGRAAGGRNRKERNFPKLTCLGKEVVVGVLAAVPPVGGTPAAHRPRGSHTIILKHDRENTAWDRGKI